MSQADFYFYGELNDFLSPERRERIFVCSFEGRQSIKHLIEALRVPHTEVGRLLVNDQVVDFSYIMQDGDRVQVYPVSNGYPLIDANTFGGTVSEPRFLLDNHLGKLATYLRMLGFDTLYRNDYQDDELAQIASQDGRILLTRDRGLLMRKMVGQGYCVRDMDPKKQIAEVVWRFDLADKIKPFRRCLRCNGQLQLVKKDAVLERLKPLTRMYYHEFRLCPGCNQVYWKGSHYERMQKFLQKLVVEG